VPQLQRAERKKVNDGQTFGLKRRGGAFFPERPEAGREENERQYSSAKVVPVKKHRSLGKGRGPKKSWEGPRLKLAAHDQPTHHPRGRRWDESKGLKASLCGRKIHLILKKSPLRTGGKGEVHEKTCE